MRAVTFALNPVIPTWLKSCLCITFLFSRIVHTDLYSPLQKKIINHPSGERSRILCVKGIGPSPIRRWDVKTTLLRIELRSPDRQSGIINLYTIEPYILQLFTLRSSCRTVYFISTIISGDDGQGVIGHPCRTSHNFASHSTTSIYSRNSASNWYCCIYPSLWMTCSFRRMLSKALRVALVFIVDLIGNVGFEPLLYHPTVACLPLHHTPIMQFTHAPNCEMRMRSEFPGNPFSS